jgi:integrase
MPITLNKLNSMQVEYAKPRKKEYNLGDGGGLYLRIKSSGNKNWIFNYIHPITRKKNNIGYGSYPNITLSDARKIAEKDRLLLSQQKDPKHEKELIKQNQKRDFETTFEGVAREWLTLKSHELRPTTLKKTTRYFEKDVFPVIGKIPIKEITASSGITVIQNISNRSSYEICRKVARLMNQVMTFAVNTGLAPHNPLIGIKDVIPKTKVIHRPTLEVDQISYLMKTIQSSNAKVITKLLLEFQLHTMVRPSEASRAEWSEIDLEKKLWVIPSEIMKMDRPHKVPLTEPCIKIIKQMQSISYDKTFVFPSSVRNGKPVNSQTANKALRDMGFKGKLVAHGLRALASTTLNEAGFDYDVIETALAHGDENKIRQAYNRSIYLDKRIEMMQWWSEYINMAKQGGLDEKS